MRVSKYNASGNDFVIFHTFYSEDRGALARRLCDRHEGVGADGLIVLKPRENGLVWEFYNNDGSVAEMCGNGSRAAIAYAYDNGLCGKSVNLLTISGEIEANVLKRLASTGLAGSADTVVEVALTKPSLIKAEFADEDRIWMLADTGVPHLVSFCEDLGEFSVELARKMRHKFNANVNYASLKDGKLYVRTYERGVENETMACGTGMAACFYVANLNGTLSDSCAVYPKSGEELGLRLENGRIYFKGAVSHCFDAFINL
ncbi:diaminopimelate epimerase [Campylobacter sp. 19-13652]|uniref:diaminopimelate epimerase n=1 Tax=Campylobacter sp. 19-13652 TaxID=2840180 RepID=UPI001C799643|nr:diaminopimelate epimerase [Campylobacter sp. 19-13652]BCX78634.1 diaminopimelate epimerase [Campylobacter sp. 19-13652]